MQNRVVDMLATLILSLRGDGYSCIPICSFIQLALHAIICMNKMLRSRKSSPLQHPLAPTACPPPYGVRARILPAAVQRRRAGPCSIARRRTACGPVFRPPPYGVRAHVFCALSQALFNIPLHPLLARRRTACGPVFCPPPFSEGVRAHVRLPAAVRRAGPCFARRRTACGPMFSVHWTCILIPTDCPPPYGVRAHVLPPSARFWLHPLIARRRTACGSMFCPPPYGVRAHVLYALGWVRLFRSCYHGNKAKTATPQSA